MTDGVFLRSPPNLVAGNNVRDGNETAVHRATRRALLEATTDLVENMNVHGKNYIQVFARIRDLTMGPGAQYWDEHVDPAPGGARWRFGDILLLEGPENRMAAMPAPPNAATPNRAIESRMRGLNRLIDEEVMRAFAIRDTTVSRADQVAPGGLTMQYVARHFLHNSARSFWKEEVLQWAREHALDPLAEYMSEALR